MKRRSLLSIALLPAVMLLGVYYPPNDPGKKDQPYTNWINKNRGCVPAECGPGTWSPMTKTGQAIYVFSKTANGGLIGTIWTGSNQGGFTSAIFDVCAGNWTAYNSGVKKWCVGYPKTPTPTTPTPTTPKPTIPPPTTPKPTTVKLPPPKVDTPAVRIAAFEAAQQGSDQTIRIPRSNTLTCDNGKTAPCNVTDGKKYKATTYWTEGPFVTGSTLVSFTLTPPAGFTAGVEYEWVKKPGADVFTRYQDAVLQFFKTTPTGKPYTYTAKVTVTYELREYKWDGAKKTLVKTTPGSVTSSNRCAPSSCSFPVQGSNG